MSGGEGYASRVVVAAAHWHQCSVVTVAQSQSRSSSCCECCCQVWRSKQGRGLEGGKKFLMTKYIAFMPLKIILILYMLLVPYVLVTKEILLIAVFG